MISTKFKPGDRIIYTNQVGITIRGTVARPDDWTVYGNPRLSVQEMDNQLDSSVRVWAFFDLDVTPHFADFVPEEQVQLDSNHPSNWSGAHNTYRGVCAGGISSATAPPPAPTTTAGPVTINGSVCTVPVTISLRQPVDGIVVTHPQTTSCQHTWRQYIGIMDQFEYCETCDVKRKDVDDDLSDL